MKWLIKIYKESILFKILIIMILCILLLQVYKRNTEPFTLPPTIIYDKISDSFKINYEISKLSKYIPLHSKILDIECSTGQYVHKLSVQGYNVTGIDRNKKHIDYCLKKYSYPFKQSNLLDTIIYPSQTYDVILCMNLSIYKIKYLTTLLQNIYDWLKYGGYVYIYCVNDLKPLFKKKYNINQIKSYDPKLTQISKLEYSLKEYINYDNQKYYYETPLYYFSKKELLTISKQHGFIIETMIELNKNESIYQFKKPN